ncbi:hypothetical protein F0160_21055 [Paraburkholderia sp. JPY303]|uniref:hypothetical protein n=1 Tax=Paraburkholderia atlantica TaxID=2654982 RepID=UPI00159115A4|nr:hypothetical protein [Paraburkholderia atlantica]NUY32978.1 hypothetical protein [Paraburkholderia atlantica]
MSEQQSAANAFACYAVGCPCWPVHKRGAHWLCVPHAAIDDPHAWPQVTTHLRAHSWLIKALARAQHIDPHEWAGGASVDAAAFVSRHGRPDLAPKRYPATRAIHDRLTGQDVTQSRTLDETASAALWVSRVRSALYDEAIKAAIAKAGRPAEDAAQGCRA